MFDAIILLLLIVLICSVLLDSMEDRRVNVLPLRVTCGVIGSYLTSKNINKVLNKYIFC